MNLNSAVQVLEMAAGGFAVGYVNDSFVAPALENAIPYLQSNHMPAKVTDAATTGITTFLGSEALKAIGLRRVARAIEAGGYFVTALKALAIPVPGAEVKLTVPSPLSLFRAQAALPAPSGAKQLTTASAAMTPYGSLSVPSPANSNADWGT